MTCGAMERIIVYEIRVSSDDEARRIIAEIESVTGMTPARIIPAPEAD